MTLPQLELELVQQSLVVLFEVVPHDVDVPHVHRTDADRKLLHCLRAYAENVHLLVVAPLRVRTEARLWWSWWWSL